MKKIPLLNTYVNNLEMDETVNIIEDFIRNKRKSFIVPINVDVVIKIEQDHILKTIVDEADIVLADGKPLIWIAKWFGTPLKAKVSGSDLVPLLCQLANEKGYSVFILGGKKGVPEQAKNNLEQNFKQLQIVGAYSPPLGFEEDIEELSKINNMISEVHPDILVACFGCPKQEKFVYSNYKKYDAGVTICAGATVDFLAGNINRAPKWMSDHGLEWFYRFLQEPKRMFKRYFVDDMKIIKLAWKYR